MMTHLLTPFLDQVARHPDAAALLTGRGRRSHCVSYGALSHLAAALTRQAPLRALEPGDPVLVLVPLSVELYALLLALFWLGAVPVLVDPGQGRAVLRHAIHTTQPKAFVGSTTAHLLRLLCPSAFGNIPHHAHLGGWVPGSQRLSTRLGADAVYLPTPGEVPPEAPALITFTSGSTGLPKAMVRSHGVLLAQLAAIQTHFDLYPGECDLMTLPVFALANLASGVASVLPDCSLKHPANVDAATLLAQCQQYHATRVTASPALLRQLCREATRQDRPLPFTKIFTGGAPVFPQFLRTLQTAAPRAAITSVYGSTEAEPIAHQAFVALTAEDWDAMAGGRGLLSGVPVPEIDLKLIRLDAPDTVAGTVTAETFTAWEVAASGEAGEVVVSGAHVVPGYLHGRGEEGTKIRVDGAGDRVTVWHRTGDVGWLDDQGRLWLLGRRQGVIRDSRGVCFPFAVSCALQNHPAIAACTTVGVGGKRVLVLEVVKGETPPTLAEVQALVPWAHVDRVVVVPRLPMDRRHNAKVNYPALWRVLAGRVDKE